MWKKYNLIFSPEHWNVPHEEHFLLHIKWANASREEPGQPNQMSVHKRIFKRCTVALNESHSWRALKIAPDELVSLLMLLLKSWFCLQYITSDVGPEKPMSLPKCQRISIELRPRCRNRPRPLFRVQVTLEVVHHCKCVVCALARHATCCWKLVSNCSWFLFFCMCCKCCKGCWNNSRHCCPTTCWRCLHFSHTGEQQKRDVLFTSRVIVLKSLVWRALDPPAYQLLILLHTWTKHLAWQHTCLQGFLKNHIAEVCETVLGNNNAFALSNSVP